MNHDDTIDLDEANAKGALDALQNLLRHIPGAGQVKQDLARLKEILLDRRAPRVVVVGRRGHGKSSLANALVGREVLLVGHVGDQPASDEWRKLEADGRVLEWLDTSGLGAGGIAEERLQHLKQQVRRAKPDVMLFVCKAKEVDAEIDATLQGLENIRNVLKKEGSTAPLIAVLTQADEMHPARNKDTPYPKEKLEYIEGAKNKLKEHLIRHHIEIKCIVPVSAYLEFEKGQLLYDGRWNISNLSKGIFDVLPDAARIEAARTFDSALELRKRVASTIVTTFSAAAFAIGAAPTGVVPDLFILVPVKQAMVTSIIYLSAKTLTWRAVAEWILSASGAGAAGVARQEVFRYLIGLIPGYGNLVSGGLAGAWTWATGQAAIAYFLDDKDIVEAQSVFREATATGNEWTPPRTDP